MFRDCTHSIRRFDLYHVFWGPAHVLMYPQHKVLRGPQRVRHVLYVSCYDVSSSSWAGRMRSTMVYKLTHAAFSFFCAAGVKETVRVCTEFQREKQWSSRSSKVPKQLSRPDLFKTRNLFIVRNVLVYLS